MCKWQKHGWNLIVSYFKAYIHFLAHKLKDVFGVNQDGGMGQPKAGNGVTGKRIREETNRKTLVKKEPK